MCPGLTAVRGDTDAYLIGAGIGRVPRQDLLLDQHRQQHREVVVGGAAIFACRRVVAQVGEVSGIDGPSGPKNFPSDVESKISRNSGTTLGPNSVGSTKLLTAPAAAAPRHRSPA